MHAGLVISLLTLVAVPAAVKSNNGHFPLQLDKRSVKNGPSAPAKTP